MHRRSRIDFISKNGQELKIESDSPSSMIYISGCQECTFLITKPVGQVYMERSSKCKLELRGKLMSSLLEVYKCSEFTLIPDQGNPLHTLNIESCDGITIQAKNPNQLQNIVINTCHNFKYCLANPYPLESTPDLSKCEVAAQYLLIWEGGCQGSLAVKALTRRGGYITTVEKAEITDQKEEEAMKKMIELAIGKVLTEKGVEPSKVDKIPANTGASKPEMPDENVEKARPLIEGTSGFKNKLGEMKDQLKPTETVVREGPVIPGAKPSPAGSGREYNISDEEQKKEFVDSSEELSEKAKLVASWIRKGKHVIFFTGAGISTSAGIPDFRSGMDTMLETGPGVWELRAHGASRRQPGKKQVQLIRALPTLTHMAIVALHESGLVKFTVSQNVDGLHRRSGLNPRQLAELHGNTNLESCSKCGVQYLRDFETREAFGVFNHETTRRCDDPSCRNILLDSIINFGEQLPEFEIKSSYEHANKADVCVVLGSSLTVNPAADIPRTVLVRKGKLAICNLQKTALYKRATLNVHSMCDKFMDELMKELEIPIPTFKLKRRAKISIEQASMLGDVEFKMEGLDVFENTPYSFIHALYAKPPNQDSETKIDKEPFSLKFKCELGSVLKVIIVFQGHYNEPDYELEVSVTPGVKQLRLEYEVSKGVWTHEISEMKS